MEEYDGDDDIAYPATSSADSSVLPAGARGGGGEASSVLLVRTGRQVQEVVVTHDQGLGRGELQQLLAGVLAGMAGEEGV